MSNVSVFILTTTYQGTLMRGTTGSRSGILRYSHGHVEGMLKIHIIEECTCVTDVAK